nr:hypothetical protein Itr_chr10CG19130 [Ipomoea trifida]
MAREGTYERNWIPARFRRDSDVYLLRILELIQSWSHFGVIIFLFSTSCFDCDFSPILSSFGLPSSCGCDLRRNRDQINDGEDGRRSGPP